MNKDKKVLYIISFVIFAVLLGTLFVPVADSRIVAAGLLAVLTPITCLLIRKRGALSINKREVVLLSTIFAALYVILVQLLGIYFGYYRNPYFVTTETLLKTVLPLVVIIITTEILRYVLLAQKNKIVSAIAFLSCVISEMYACSTLSELNSVNHFMDLVGLTLFPAISANIYYHYTSKRYGMFPSTVLRTVITLYVYFIPNITGISNAMSACLKLFLPLGVLALVSALYEKGKKNAIRRGQKLSTVTMIFAILSVTFVAMLISCQFRFGALVIATESMTGEINKGDMIIYEQYDDQPIEVGQVIVFTQNNQNRIVHRVIKIETVNGEKRYYTQGDANPTPDEAYRTEADIIGLTDLKLAYVGYPTLWLNELLEGSN